MTWDFSPTASVRTEGVLRGQVSIAQQRCPEMHKTGTLSEHCFKEGGGEKNVPCTFLYPLPVITCIHVHLMRHIS